LISDKSALWPRPKPYFSAEAGGQLLKCLQNKHQIHSDLSISFSVTSKFITLGFSYHSIFSVTEKVAEYR
jgi:hypothetical protein